MHAWGSCTPTDCDWGEEQGEMWATASSCDGTRTITESGPGRLFVSTYSVYADDRPPRLIEEAFVPM